MNELLKKVGEALFKNKQSVTCVSLENEYITPDILLEYMTKKQNENFN